MVSMVWLLAFGVALTAIAIPTSAVIGELAPVGEATARAISVECDFTNPLKPRCEIDPDN